MPIRFKNVNGDIAPTADTMIEAITKGRFDFGLDEATCSTKVPHKLLQKPLCAYLCAYNCIVVPSQDISK
jgi:hypothetical protein